MGNRILIAVFLIVLFPGVLAAQSDSYTLSFAPDAWYNEVDGIRLGARVLGEMEGTFQDGPHRLEAGLWLGTAIPEHPLSYYFSFTEPIAAISSYGSEGNVRLNSSVRTGFSRHELSLNKRWQKGFDEYDYIHVTGGLRIEKRFDESYVHYPEYWESFPKQMSNYINAEAPKKWHTILNLGLKFSSREESHYQLMVLNFDKSINEPMGRFNNHNFWIATATFNHAILLSDFEKFKFRLFADYNSRTKFTPFEYHHSISGAKSIAWLENPFTRAKGTLPSSWFDSGLIQVAGGANIRGMAGERFVYYEDGMFSEGEIKLNSLTASINFELDFPNYLNRKLRSTLIGDFLSLNTYLFYDQGIFRSMTDDFTIGNIGTGISFDFNIPDFLGNRRGFFIRYDMPLYLFLKEFNYPEAELESTPPKLEFKTEFGFKFRQIIGFGAVISF